MTFINWVIDSLASEDVIDLYFVLSDLVDIHMTDAELAEQAHYDAECRDVMHKSGATHSYDPVNRTYTNLETGVTTAAGKTVL